MKNGNGAELVKEIDTAREQGTKVKVACMEYGESHGLSPASVQAMYYQYKKSLKPVEPESTASQLRRLASVVEDLENRQNELDRILSKKPG